MHRNNYSRLKLFNNLGGALRINRVLTANRHQQNIQITDRLNLFIRQLVPNISQMQNGNIVNAQKIRDISTTLRAAFVVMKSRNTLDENTLCLILALFFDNKRRRLQVSLYFSVIIMISVIVANRPYISRKFGQTQTDLA